jgi:hypothetical protein
MLLSAACFEHREGCPEDQCPQREEHAPIPPESDGTDNSIDQGSSESNQHYIRRRRALFHREAPRITFEGTSLDTSPLHACSCNEQRQVERLLAGAGPVLPPEQHIDRGRRPHDHQSTDRVLLAEIQGDRKTSAPSSSDRERCSRSDRPARRSLLRSGLSGVAEDELIVAMGGGGARALALEPRPDVRLRT